MEYPENNIQQAKPEISFTDNHVEITYHNLKLDAQNSASPEVTIFIKKQPIRLIEGKVYNDSCVLIDKETEKMKHMSDEAKKLLEIPEINRPRKVLEIFKKEVGCAYEDVIDKLSKTSPEKAAWITKNTGPDSRKNNVPLSEIIENGFAVCRHLSVAYLWLAQKAGLQGVILHSIGGRIVNITRTDNNEKLFRSREAGQTMQGHSWVEIKMPDDKWMPVDPSVNLVGDTEENFAMFEKANYVASCGSGVDSSVNKNELQEERTELLFSPGESITSGRFSLGLKFRIGDDHLQLPSIPYSGDGELKLTTTNQKGRYELSFLKGAYELHFIRPTTS